jgi:hypothetical protein
MERLRSVHNGIRDQAVVEGGKLSTMCSVLDMVPARTGKRGTPLRVFRRDPGGFSLSG